MRRFVAGMIEHGVLLLIAELDDGDGVTIRDLGRELGEAARLVANEHPDVVREDLDAPRGRSRIVYRRWRPTGATS